MARVYIITVTYKNIISLLEGMAQVVMSLISCQDYHRQWCCSDMENQC